MSRFLRYLRIAFSATCLIACVLLIALWVRSYWRADTPTTTKFGRVFEFISLSGNVVIRWADIPSEWGSAPFTIPLTENDRDPFDEPPPDHYRALGFRFSSYPEFRFLSIPYWFPILLCSILAALPWFRWRFSLRTLLIATTLVAVVLGLVVWSIH
jgi:hypothetical protein